MVGAWSDITARRQLGEVLVAAQDRLVHLLSSARAVIYSYRASGDFAPTFVSQNIVEVLGYMPAEYLEDAEFWRRCVHPDELAAVEAEAVHLFRKGHHTVEYRFLKKDGTYCWVNDEQRLVRDKQGQPEEVVGSWSDVSERKTAEEAVEAARVRVEHLLASSPAVIYSFKASGDYAPTFISQNIKDLLGYERADYLESPDFWVSRVHPEDSPRIMQRLCEADRRGATFSEYRFRKKDGSYCWVSDELRVLREARRAGRGRRRLERCLGEEAARRSAGGGAEPARPSARVRAGGDLQLQGHGRLRADFRQPEHPRLAGLRAGGISREPGILVAARPRRRPRRRGGAIGLAVPEGPPHGRVSVSPQGWPILLGQR